MDNRTSPQNARRNIFIIMKTEHVYIQKEESRSEKIRNLFGFIYSSGLLLLLASCQGVYGLSSFDTVKTMEGTISKVETWGFEVRTVRNYKGITVGNRNSIYFTPYRHYFHGEVQKKSYGALVLSETPPVFSQSITRGFEIACEPSYFGISLGIDYRACVSTDINQSAVLHINSKALNAKDQFKYQSY